MAITISIADGLEQDELTTGFTIPVTVTDVTADAPQSFTVDVVYDSSVISITGATPTGLTSGKSLTVNPDFGGTGDTIRVAFADAFPLSGSGTLFELDVDAVSVGNSTLVIETATFDEGGVSVTTDDGDIDIISRTPSFSYSGVDATGNIVEIVTRAYETLVDKTAGVEDPEWSFLRNPSTGAFQEIVADGGATGGKVLRLESIATSGRYILLLDTYTADDQDIVFRFRESDTGSMETSFYTRASGSEGAEEGYFVALTGTTAFNAYEYNAGSISFKQTGTTTPARSSDTWYWVRIRSKGTFQQFRMWADGDNEPGGWFVNFSDASHTGGKFGISIICTAAGQYLDIDLHSIGQNGITALTVPEDDLPDIGIGVAAVDDLSIRLVDPDTSNEYVVAFPDSNIVQISYRVSNDTFYCSSAGSSRIFSISRLGYDETDILTSDAYTGCEVDEVNGYLYYQAFTTADVRRVDLDTWANDTLLYADTSPGYLIKYSESEDKIYFASDDQFHRMDPDGGNYQLLQSLANAQSIISNGTYFWWSSAGNTILRRTNVDNTGTLLMLFGGSSRQDIVVDEANSKIYVSEAGGDKITQAEYDGSSAVVIVSGPSYRGMAWYESPGLLGTATTPEYAYAVQDATFTGGAFTVIATTPEVAYEGVDGVPAPGELIKQGGTPEYTYTAIIATSNIVSGFHDNLGGFEYSGVDGVGITTATYLTFDVPVQRYTYEDFTVDVLASDVTSLGVTSFQCNIGYNTDIVSVIEVTPVGLTNGESLTVNLSTPGVIAVAWAGVSPLTGSGILFRIRFYGKVVAFPYDTGGLTFNSFMWNEGTPASTTTDAVMLISANTGITPEYSYIVVTPQQFSSGTPEYSYMGVNGHPVLATGGIGFGVPPDPIVYVTITPAASFATTTGVGSTPEFSYDGVSGVYTAPNTSGIATTPVITYAAISSTGVTIGLGPTPSITYVGVLATEETFGIPRKIKLESYNPYSAKVNVVPRVFDGINHVGEDLLIQVLLFDSEDQPTTVPGLLYAIILTPDRNILGPFEMVESEVGHFTYEWNATLNGVHWVRIQNPLSDIIEEERFVVRESKVFK